MKVKGITKKEKSLKFRFISALTSFMILTMTVLPSAVITSVSAAVVDKDGVEIVSDEAEKVKLLVGSKSDIAGSSVTETINKANAKYLLGIASQFGVLDRKSTRLNSSHTS